MKNEVKSTIRLSKNMWVQIQRMKIADLVNGIQDAVLQGLALLTSKHEDEMNRQQQRNGTFKSWEKEKEL